MSAEGEAGAGGATAARGGAGGSGAGATAGVGGGIAGDSAGGAGGAGGSGGFAGGLPGASCASYEASPPVARLADVAGKLVWTGRDYVALWAVSEKPVGARDGTAWYHIHWARLDRASNVVAERTSYSAMGFDWDGWPVDFGTASVMAIVPSDEGFGALWYEEKDERFVFMRLDGDGASAAGPVVLGPGSVGDPAALAWNGTSFGAVWRVPSSQVLRLTTIDRAGGLAGSGELAKVTALLGPLYLFGQSDGSFLMLLELVLPTLNEVRWARFDPAGNPVSGSQAALLSDPNVYAARLLVDRLADPDRYAVHWSETPRVGGGERTPILRYLDATGTVVAGPFAIDTAVGPLVGLAHGGDALGAIVGENDALGFQSLGSDGTTQGARIEIAPRAPMMGGGTPVPGVNAISWNGDGFGVFWIGMAPAGWGAYYTEVRCMP